jgi:hypothetical protein
LPIFVAKKPAYDLEGVVAYADIGGLCGLSDVV